MFEHDVFVVRLADKKNYEILTTGYNAELTGNSENLWSPDEVQGYYCFIEFWVNLATVWCARISLRFYKCH